MLNVNSLTAKPAIGRSEYGRVKVALPKGKGLMDWVRLSSTKVLAKKRLSSVDHVELMKHNIESDCWIHLFGQVYDVTSYLDFHPGGIPELLRAAGRDATDLFNQYHAWVNYESMLKSCLVGRFTGDLSKLPPCGPPTVDETINTSRKPSENFLAPQPSVDLGIDVRIEASSILISSREWHSLQSENVVCSADKEDAKIRVLVRHFDLPSVEITWESVPDGVLVPITSVEAFNDSMKVVLADCGEDLNSALADCKRTIRKRSVVKYHECVLQELRPVSRDTFLYTLSAPEGVYLPIPLGQHVSLKIKKGMVVQYRPYTPVGYTLPINGLNGTVTLMIKIYPNGACTSNLKGLKIGDVMEISDPIGDKDIPEWIGDSSVVILAAGTGITPMLPIISWLLKQSGRRTDLLLFNKTEEDIVTDDWTPIRWENEQIKVHHVLSSPSAEWHGFKGRINASHLPPIDGSTRVLLCGPDGFIDTAMRLLESVNVTKQNIHIFQG